MDFLVDLDVGRTLLDQVRGRGCHRGAQVRLELGGDGESVGVAALGRVAQLRPTLMNPVMAFLRLKRLATKAARSTEANGAR